MICRGLLLCVLLLVLVSCGSGDRVSLGIEDNDSQIELVEGQIMEIILESNPSTGYSWEIAELEETILVLQGEPVYRDTDPRDPPPPGAGGVEIFQFEAKSTGSTALTLVYHRSWEEDIEPVETFSVEIIVR